MLFLSAAPFACPSFILILSALTYKRPCTRTTPSCSQVSTHNSKLNAWCATPRQSDNSSQHVLNSIHSSTNSTSSCGHATTARQPAPQLTLRFANNAPCSLPRQLHLCAHCSSLRSSQNVRNCAREHHVQSKLTRHEQQHRRRVVCRRQAQTRTHTRDIRVVDSLVSLFLPARAAGLFSTLLYVRLVAAAGFFRSVSLHTADIVQTRDAGRETDTRSHSVCRHRKRGTTISHANCWHALLSNKRPCKSRRSALLLCRRRQRRQHHTARALESETTTPRQRRQAQLQHSVAPRPDSVRAILAGLRVQQMTPALCL